MIELLDLIQPLLAAAAPAAAEPQLIVPSKIEPTLLWVVRLGLMLVMLGIMFCLYRLVRGPHLADRVLAADTLSLHVIALVILLSIVLKTTAFFDAVLVVAILGFVSTVGFSQYICANADKESPQT